MRRRSLDRLRPPLTASLHPCNQSSLLPNSDRTSTTQQPLSHLQQTLHPLFPFLKPTDPLSPPPPYRPELNPRHHRQPPCINHPTPFAPTKPLSTSHHSPFLPSRRQPNLRPTTLAPTVAPSYNSHSGKSTKSSFRPDLPSTYPFSSYFRVVNSVFRMGRTEDQAREDKICTTQGQGSFLDFKWKIKRNGLLSRGRLSQR